MFCNICDDNTEDDAQACRTFHRNSEIEVSDRVEETKCQKKFKCLKHLPENEFHVSIFRTQNSGRKL